MFGREKQGDDLKEGERPGKEKLEVRAVVRERTESPDAAWDAQIANKKTLGEKVYSGLAKLKGMAPGVIRGMLKLTLAGLVSGGVGGTIAGLIGGDIGSIAGAGGGLLSFYYTHKKLSGLGNREKGEKSTG